MKRKSEYYPPFKDEGEVVASWGEAKLIKYLSGKSELRGGYATGPGRSEGLDSKVLG